MKKIFIIGIYLIGISCILIAWNSWAIDTSTDIPIPFLVIAIDGEQKSIPTSTELTQELLWLCSRQTRQVQQPCTEYILQIIASLLTQYTNQEKGRERAEACGAFYKLDEEIQSEMLIHFGGYNPCR